MINSVVNTGFPPAVKAQDTAGSVHATTQAASKPSPVQTAAPDTKQLKEAVSKLNDYVQNSQRNLSFSVDKDSGQTVVKVYDAQTKELIRQIPSDETLKLAASIDEQVTQFFIKDKV